MKIAKYIAALGVLGMIAAFIYGFAAGDLGEAIPNLLKNPWWIVTLVDLSTGILLFSGWIVYREASIGRALIWVLLVSVLGFFAGSVYILVTLNASKGDWKVFWMGARADRSDSKE